MVAKRKPSAEDLKKVDMLIFDIQDVGVRFYTYISSLEEFMEAAFENGQTADDYLTGPIQMDIMWTARCWIRNINHL